MVYALAGGSSLQARAEATFGAEGKLLSGIEQFGADLRKYLLVRAQLGVFAAILSAILLWVLNVPFPLLWAFLVFAASFIPNIGTFIAVVPPTILALLGGGVVPAVAVVVGYTLINFAQDHFLQPVVMGSELNLTPLVVFLSVLRVGVDPRARRGAARGAAHGGPGRDPRGVPVGGADRGPAAQPARRTAGAAGPGAGYGRDRGRDIDDGRRAAGRRWRRRRRLTRLSAATRAPPRRRTRPRARSGEPRR